MKLDVKKYRILAALDGELLLRKLCEEKKIEVTIQTCYIWFEGNWCVEFSVIPLNQKRWTEAAKKFGASFVASKYVVFETKNDALAFCIYVLNEWTVCLAEKWE